ncbi:RNA-binding protein [Aquibacillus saliphilus]|uniref:YlmH family RNA-binding protein n=1 Tax=Aquibacillus saliphilus TaxID=1909422 RepID=UPI001CF048C1
MDIYQHFRKEEHPFIDQVLSWKESLDRNYQRRISDFLTPREQTIFQSIVGNNEDYTWGLFGGIESERKRAILAPYYEEINQSDYGITLLEATYPTKFITLEHRDVLGAFLSMGIKRKKLGDLIVQEGVIQIIVAEEVATYVKTNLIEVKKAKVSLAETSIDNLLPNNETWESRATTVASLRLDVVIKDIYNISRQNAVDFIQKGLVKVNFRKVENPAFQLEEADLISLRGKGRSRLKEIHGLSKKEKWKITTEKLK